MADLIRLPMVRETHSAQTLTLYEPARAEDCDGARTLRLVERAVDSMQELRARADQISAQAVDLIRLTHHERSQMQAELQQAREDARGWEKRAQDAQCALALADLRIREADLARREAELATHCAEARADKAEARASSLEFYLKKIGGFLQSRLVPVS